MPSLLLSKPAVTPLSWVWFDSADNTTNWYNEAKAVDGNTSTYAIGSGADFSNYLILRLVTAKLSSQVKVWVENDPIGGADATLTIEVSPNGTDSWTEIKNGTILNGNVNGWQTISFSQQSIKAMRIKRNSDTASYVNGVQVGPVSS